MTHSFFKYFLLFFFTFLLKLLLNTLIMHSTLPCCMLKQVKLKQCVEERVPPQVLISSDGISDGCCCHSCCRLCLVTMTSSWADRQQLVVWPFLILLCACPHTQPMMTFQISSPHLVLQTQYPRYPNPNRLRGGFHCRRRRI